MGSFSGTCEIVEASEELNLGGQHSRSYNDKDQKFPMLRLGNGKNSSHIQWLQWSLLAEYCKN